MVSYMKNKTILISVVVCTYNRPQLLKKCLQSLIKQSIDKNLYEVIVVNNNSTKDTLEVVSDFAKNHPIIKIVTEKKLGHSYARNLGWKHAKGKYVAFIDDDAHADNDWMAEIISFTKKYPTVGVFGGPYKRYFLIPPPRWFPDGYGTLNLGKKVKQIYPPKEWLTGTNVIFKKILFEKFGGFNINFGLRGHTTIYGEETELMFKLYQLGEKIYYVPTIKVNHLVAQYKYNMWWLLKNDFYHSYSSSLFIRKKLGLIKDILLFLLSLLLFPLYLFDIKPRLLKTKVYYGLSNVFLAFGQIIGSLNNL